MPGSNDEESTMTWRLRLFRPAASIRRGVCVAALLLSASVVAPAESLSLCSKCVNPTIFAQTGTDTANATALARITRQEIEGWCANWQPGDAGCVSRSLKEHDLQKVYRASADCTGGRITAVDGSTYRLAGIWDNSDIGGGRSKWRDAQGQVVGRDNASGGLDISQQWEVLCPSGGKRANAAAAAAVPALKPEFAVGQVVLAQYGSRWIRGKVDRVRQVKGRNGPELAYEVSLDNGKRGLVPARMLRKP